MTIPQNRRNILEFFGQARDENEARVTHERGGREQQHEALRANDELMTPRAILLHICTS